MSVSSPHLCPTCGRPSVPRKKVSDALAFVKAGVRPAVAARAAGISRQLLNSYLRKQK